MDDFINKNSNSHRPRVSIDGISPGRGQQSRGSISFDRPINRPPNFQKSPRVIDDFRRPSGLSRPQSNSVIDAPVQPIPLPQPPSTVKKRFVLGQKERRPRLDGIERTDKRAARKRRLKIASASCMVLILVGFAGFAYLKNIFGGGGGAAALQENVDPSKLRGEGDGRVNVLLMGRGGAGADGPDLTDTIIVLSIDPVNNEAGLVSIPRDLYVTIPDMGAMKLNQVFYTGKSQVLNNTADINDKVKKQADAKGYELAKSAVEQVLGIPIHYRSMIDFQGFEEAVDTVGGIDVNVPKKVHEQMRFNGQPYTLDVKKGQKHFDGFEALAYARSRYSSNGGDFDRSERQRLMLVAFKDKVMSTGTLTNPAKVTGLLNDFGSHVDTDFNLADLSRLQEIFRQVDSSRIASIGLVDPPHDFLATTTVGGLSVVLPKAGADDYGAVHKYIRNTLRDGYLKSENANVMVLNGTQREGLATEKAEELRSYGYNIGTVSNTANGRAFASTVIVDLRGGSKKYTKRYLEQRFGTAAISSLPDQSIQPGNADFVIILGNDTRSGL